MIRRFMLALLCAAAVGSVSLISTDTANANDNAFGRRWGTTQKTRNWERFYHYPYVYYPQNFWGKEYYRSSESLYYRYAPEMRIPVYNKQWHNYYPEGQKYHYGHHFRLDVF